MRLIVLVRNRAAAVRFDWARDKPRGVTFVTLLLAVLFTDIGSHAADWPTYLGSNGDGRSEETIGPLPASGQLKVLYEVPMDEGYGGVSIASGRAFVFDRVKDQIRLRALEADSGKPLWEQSYESDYKDLYDFSPGPRMTPVVDDERVYTFGPEGRLRCHAVVNGELLWEVDAQTRYNVVQNFFGVGTHPLLFKELLLVLVGGSPKSETPLEIHQGDLPNSGSAIVAFDRKTGEERYRLGEALASYSSPVVTRHGGRDWAFVHAREGLLAFEPTKGKVDFLFPWRAKKLQSVNAANPVVVGDSVFITEAYGPGGAMIRFADGKAVPRWKDDRRNQRMASHWGTPIEHDGWLYGASGESRGNAEFRAVSVSDGEIGWRQKGWERTSQILVGGTLVVVSESGEIRFVKPAGDKSELLASFTPKQPEGKPLVDYPSWTAPSFSDGLLFVRGASRMVVFDLRPPRPVENSKKATE